MLLLDLLVLQQRKKEVNRKKRNCKEWAGVRAPGHRHEHGAGAAQASCHVRSREAGSRRPN